MMKKVSFCHLKSTLMGKNSQRSTEGERTVNTNGDVRIPEHLSLEVDQSDTESLCRTVLKTEENKHKSNIFKTLRWKWRKHKRNKNGDISCSWHDSLSKHNCNCRDDSQESACNFRSNKVNPKHSISKRVVCPVPSAKKCVKRDSNLDYCDIDEESESDRHSACCLCNNTSTTINNPRITCNCSSSLESDTNSVSLQKIENVNQSANCDETRTLDSKDQRSVSSHTAMVQPQPCISSSHLSNSETALENSNTDVANRINCGSTALVPSYGTNSTSSSDVHLYESVSEVPQIGSLALELAKLAKCGWYWGPITRGEAEEKLANQPDGAFLVRDSSDDHYLLSLSFRSYTRTFHTRIEHCNGLFSFYSHPEPDGHTSIVELIQQSMNFSQSGAFCYSRSRSPEAPSFPVRLTRPISRFTQVRSLQYLCRFTIRQHTRFDLLQKLPIPSSIKGYLEQRQY